MLSKQFDLRFACVIKTGRIIYMYFADSFIQSDLMSIEGVCYIKMELNP